MLDPTNDTTPPPSLAGFQLEIFGPGSNSTIREFTEEGIIGRVVVPQGAINAGLGFDIVNVTGINPTTTTDLTSTFIIDAQGFIILNESLVLNTSIHENLNFEIEITGPGGGSSLRQSFDIGIEPIADATFTRIVGDSGNNTLILNPASTDTQVAAGGAGDDMIDDNAAEGDILLGGSGVDTFNIGTPSTGRDTVFGGSGDDMINNDSNGGDVLNGGAGNDTFELGVNSIGNDTLNGGSGDDIFIIETNAANMTGADTIRGGAGNDTIEIFNVDTNDIIEGGAGFDTLKLTNDAAPGTFDLTTTGNISGIERIELDDQGNDLVLMIDGNFIAGQDGDTTNGGVLIIEGGMPFAPIPTPSGTTITLTGNFEQLINTNVNFGDLGIIIDTMNAAVFREIGTDNYIVQTDFATSASVIDSDGDLTAGTPTTGIDVNMTTEMFTLPPIA